MRRATVPARPGDVIRDLVTLLGSHGLTRLYWSACSLRAVLSLPGITVWTDGRHLSWQHQGAPTTWPATATDQAARELAILSRRSRPGPETS
jgi:hypothetical protein